MAETVSGTRVTESFQVLTMPKIMEWGVGLFVPAHLDRSNDLSADLARLKQVTESGWRGSDQSDGTQRPAREKAPPDL